MRLLALAGLLALTLSAHADLYTGNYNVYINGGQAGTNGVTTFSFASIPNVGVVHFSAYLTSTTATFVFDNGHIYGPPNPAIQVNQVEFVGNRVADYITGINVDPSSTATGIVASTHVTPGITGSGGILVYPYTYIDFDFTNANVFPGATATFDFSFTPQTAPEIEPFLAPSSLVLIAGAIAILRGRRIRPSA